jgi:hypothetical protein
VQQSGDRRVQLIGTVQNLVGGRDRFPAGHLMISTRIRSQLAVTNPARIRLSLASGSLPAPSMCWSPSERVNLGGHPDPLHADPRFRELKGPTGGLQLPAPLRTQARDPTGYGG